jgi:hypothetical protein
MFASVNAAACVNATNFDQKSSMCEVGDLSGKHGVFTGYSEMATFMDGNLPLFGANSVVGRSIVIHSYTVSQSNVESLYSETSH